VQDWLAEGRQEGLEEGEARCEAKVTLRLLNRRCGPLTDTNTAQIIALLDFQGPDDLATWLAASA